METRHETNQAVVNGLHISTLLTAGLLGTAAVQVRRARRRYGEAAPAVSVIDTVVRPPGRAFADGRPLELVALGDSAMAGVGVDQLTDTLPVQVATHTAAATGRPVHVVSHAVSGARTRDVLRSQVSLIAGRPDVVILLVGTNDVTHVTRRRSLNRETTALLAALNRLGAPVVMSSLPELRAMRAIPFLVRLVLAREAAVVRNVQSRAAATAPDVALVDVRGMVGQRFVADISTMSADRFHPSAEGYRLIAEALSPMVIADTTPHERLVFSASTPVSVTHRSPAAKDAERRPSPVATHLTPPYVQPHLRLPYYYA